MAHAPAPALGEPQELLSRWKEGSLLNRDEMNALVAHLLVFKENVTVLLYGLAASHRPCTLCGAPLWFLPTGKMKEGKPVLMPVSPAGQSHFKDCPHANEFGRARS